MDAAFDRNDVTVPFRIVQPSRVTGTPGLAEIGPYPGSHLGWLTVTFGSNSVWQRKF